MRVFFFFYSAVPSYGPDPPHVAQITVQARALNFSSKRRAETLSTPERGSLAPRVRAREKIHAPTKNRKAKKLGGSSRGRRRKGRVLAGPRPVRVSMPCRLPELNKGLSSPAGRSTRGEGAPAGRAVPPRSRAGRAAYPAAGGRSDRGLPARQPAARSPPPPPRTRSRN